MGSETRISDKYFRNRRITPQYYSDYKFPRYLYPILPADRGARIIDIGCGFGQTLTALRGIGYTNLRGIDISVEAIEHCQHQGLDVRSIENLKGYCLEASEKFRLILMSHVLEHIPKDEIIDTLRAVRERLMEEDGGALFLAVPNAQSPTGCYWAYEDFTHTTLFTAGSLLYVLRAAGFSEIQFLDPDGLEGGRWLFRLPKWLLLRCYRAKVHFWNLVTNSAFHRPSPRIFTYELKALAR